ncbi:helix-turn-helix domain-containing protein [Bordetella bronchiseptica]|uniref:helix-turn-helix domain-containing protein n=1 Tax=Bordetella bronchiseptica TaxID=518 RepID=UPI00052836E2|nr:helix-turn-helix transcriptional regulator [Bordetella bronchiseptica]AZW22940.1 XRE family transcriptional regulator [Bordetella bronchiseptica]
MKPISIIRQRLGVTQAALAVGIGVTQGNVSHYERGQTIPPDVARRLIDFARSQGLSLTFDQIYAPEPEEVPQEVA